MQIVINIDEVLYNQIINNTRLKTYLELAVQDGILLPKGHGRLIDESKITTVYFHKEEGSWKNIKYEHSIIDYTDAPTILEADKEKE